jgi:hypothetical protein
MKITVKRPVEIEVSHVRISVPLHDDTTQEMGESFPLLNGDTWSGTVEIETGKIVEWPEGLAGHFVVGDKVRDGGTYTLLAPDGSEVSSIRENYVPNGVVPGEYGDYIDLDIKDGVVDNWPKRPDLSDFFPSDDD